jgi:cell wall-associated NlpC family hydrolase
MIDGARTQAPETSMTDGYEPGDLIFFGVDDGPNGHVAIWLGNGMIVQCSASGNGSNIRPLAGYVAPTGWVRWNPERYLTQVMQLRRLTALERGRSRAIER